MGQPVSVFVHRRPRSDKTSLAGFADRRKISPLAGAFHLGKELLT
jgi:hypothetical protein